jgi:peroxisomal 3,2-trans-enoyl-CoA isomerase
LASEALLLARPISGKDLNRVGFINRAFDGQFKTTEEFNDYIYKMISDQFENLHEDSIFKNKKLLKANRDQLINSANSNEAIRGFRKWIEGVPQAKFAQLAKRDIKHKI